MTKNIESFKVSLQGHSVEMVTNMPIEDIYYLLDLIDSSQWGMANAFETLEWIGSGSFGRVYGYKDYAIKYLKDINDDNNDIDVLKALKHIEAIPTLYAVIDDRILIMERVYGMTVRDYCNYGKDDNNKYGLDWGFMNDFDNALLEVVKAGYSPHDMHESNVMIDSRTKKPRLVDVGFFKPHNEEYDNYDIHTIKNSDRGYSNADRWTGTALRNYFHDLQRKLKREADEILAKYDGGYIKSNVAPIGSPKIVAMQGGRVKVSDMHKYHEMLANITVNKLNLDFRMKLTELNPFEWKL